MQEHHHQLQSHIPEYKTYCFEVCLLQSVIKTSSRFFLRVSPSIMEFICNITKFNLGTC